MFWARDEFKKFVDDVKDQTHLEIMQCASRPVPSSHRVPRTPFPRDLPCGNALSLANWL
jgi:hypothetical protein